MEEKVQLQDQKIPKTEIIEKNEKVQIPKIEENTKSMIKSEEPNQMQKELSEENLQLLKEKVNFIEFYEIMTFCLIFILSFYFLVGENLNSDIVNPNPLYNLSNVFQVKDKIQEAFEFQIEQALLIVQKYILATEFLSFISVLIFILFFFDSKVVKSYYNFLFKIRGEKKGGSRDIVLGSPIKSITNKITTTFYSGDILLNVVFYFFYSCLVYLSQKIQIWSMSIALVQLYLFNSHKSFVPLIFFTILESFVSCLGELEKRGRDDNYNNKKVKLASGDYIPRGDISPGDQILLSNGQTCPCDLILIGAISKRKKVIAFMNQVQVTGENASIRKFIYKKNIEKIHVENLDYFKAIINDKDEIDEKYIAFGSSTVVCDQDVTLIGLAVWVSTETRALKKPPTFQAPQPTPYSDYTNRAFIFTLFLLLSLSFTTTIMAYLAHKALERPSLFTIWINNLLYMNMIIPQAINPMKNLISKFLSYSFQKKSEGDINCNQTHLFDVLGHVGRVVTDKTGTLTENKMVPIGSMIFTKEEEFIIDPSKKSQNLNIKKIMENLYSIFSNAENEPEEVTMLNVIKDYAVTNIEKPNQKPEPNEDESGEVFFKTSNDDIHTIIIHSNFGLKTRIVSKSCLIQVGEKYYVTVQAGDKRFWNEIINTEYNTEKMKKWEEFEKSLTRPLGAPRIWSHGYKEITKDYALEVIEKWRKISKDSQLASEQLEFIKSVLQGIQISSQTIMIDKYRSGVIEGIQELHKKDKQVFICTGDGSRAAKEIATQLGYPKNKIEITEKIKHNSTFEEKEKQMIEALKECKNTQEQSTLFFDRKSMELLVEIESKYEFNHESFNLIFDLLQKRSKNEGDYHYFVFCEATPSLKPWVVKLAQYKKQGYFESFFGSRNYVISVGDGSNDMNMLNQADISLGIKSGETEDIIQKSVFWSYEWQPLVKLLTRTGPQKSTLILLMVRLIFFKHFMTAFTLLTDLFFRGNPLIPFDPVNPILNMIFNIFTFFQILSHSSQNQKENINIQKSNNMKSLIRFLFGGSMNGIFICIIIRSLFHNLSLKDFGNMILASQIICITFDLIFLTNHWTLNHDKDIRSLHDKEKTSIFVISLALSLLINGHFIFNDIRLKVMIYLFSISLILQYYKPLMDYLAKYRNILMFETLTAILQSKTNPDMKEKTSYFDYFVNHLISWSHTRNARLLICFIFCLIIKFVTQIHLIYFIFIFILIIISSRFTFFFAIYKTSPLKLLFSGNIITIIYFLIMIWYFVERAFGVKLFEINF